LQSKVFSSSLELTYDEKKWCDEKCIHRYLRAREWDLDKSETMLLETLKWRREMKPTEIKKEEVSGLLELGSMYHNGIDKKGRPIIYFKPGASNPFTPEERLKYLVFMMEQVTQPSSSNGEEKITWVLDFSDYGNRSKSPEGKQVSKNTMNVLQNHYPERLGAAILVNSPWYFGMLYTIMSPFLQSETKKKIHWASGSKEEVFKKLTEWIDEDQLEQQYGGKNSLKVTKDVKLETSKEEKVEDQSSDDSAKET